MKQLLHKLAVATRAKDWRLSFVPFIMGCVYLWLWLFQLPLSGHIGLLTFLSLVTTIGFASLGYFINEFFDKQSDAKAGKINKLAHLSPIVQLSIFCGALLITFVPWIWLPSSLLSWVLIVLQVVLFFIYSMPVPRVKERPYLSLITDAAYAYIVPLALSFHTFSLIANRVGFSVWLYFFLIAVCFIGIRNIIIHQIFDALKDARSGHKTFPVLKGIATTQKVLFALTLYESFFLLLALSILSLSRPDILIYLLIHCGFLFYSLKALISSKFKSGTEKMTINYSYLYVFPLVMLFLAGLNNYYWWCMLPIHTILLVPNFFVEKIVWLVIRMYQYTRSLLIVEVRHAISCMINYPIYYLFKLFGTDLIKEQKTAAEVLLKKKVK